MDIEIREFITYLHNRKRTSHNTEVSYQRDLKKMAVYFADRGIYDIRDVGELELEGYLSYMERGQFASSTISRNVASIRALFQYLYQENRIERDPSLELKPPKVEKRMPEILTVDEVDRLLKQPDLNTPKGIRDSAMLELLYATGMRVSELLRLNLEDLNLRLGYVVCHDEDKERVIPIGNVCKTAMEKYLKEARGKFVKENETVKVCSHNGNVFSVEPPNFVELEVTETDPGFKGDTATNVTKAATVETGAVIQVPIFIEEGEIIQIDTRTGEYLGRSK